MNGPRTMYRMKPLNFENFVPNDRSGMYKLKNIHAASAPSFSPEEKVEMIKSRQEALLKRIDELKNLLDAISQLSDAPKIAQPTTKMAGEPDLSKLERLDGLVLNVNPKNLPYSLIALTKIWDWFPKISFAWHKHSSISELDAEAQKFQDELTRRSVKNGLLKVTFIWKDVPDCCEVVVSPIKRVPLRGEMSLLSLLDSSVYQEPDVLTRAIREGRLDSCHILGWSDNDEESEALVKDITEGLDQSRFLMGDNVTIVDIALWSTVKKLSARNHNVTRNPYSKLMKWYNQCDKFIMST